MATARPSSPSIGTDLTHALGTRAGLAPQFAAIRLHVGRSMDDAALAAWTERTAGLYAANAGPRLLNALWSLERRLAPARDGSPHLAIVEAVRAVCRHASAADALAAIAAAERRVRPGDGGREATGLLSLLADVAERAPDVVAAVAGLAATTLADLPPGPFAAWVDEGLRLYPDDRRRRRSFFALDDPLARARLALHRGGRRIGSDEPRLRLLTRALWGFELDLREQPAAALGGQAARCRLAGGLLLVPDTIPAVPDGRTCALFEAMAMHAAAHRRFTTERFSVGALKPVQLALTALIEDARVERLAGRMYPGLLDLWRSFHTAPATRAQTVPSLFERLARALIDPDFVDGDAWIAKGRSLFETAVATDPSRQSLSRDIANVLGHDLGQLRIPYVAKNYVVTPAYRDDGLGLFDSPDTDPQSADAIALLLDGVRLERREETGGTSDEQEGQERARARSEAQPESRDVLSLQPEWNERLRVLLPDHVTVRETPFGSGDRTWLDAALDAHAGLGARIGSLIGRARLDRPTRLRRRLDGEDLDLDAAQDVMIARRAGEAPDPRIHAIKRRQRRSVAMSLLLDASESTGTETSPGGETILRTAALAAALLGQALSRLDDPYAIIAFASDGRDDVRATTVKSFADPATLLVERLAALRPGFSTRIGPIIRHATAGLAAQATHRKVLIVVTDGEPADIDVDDPDALVADARHAVADARTRGLDVFCVALGRHAEEPARAIFGRRNTLAVQTIADLPRRLGELYFRLTVS